MNFVENYLLYVVLDGALYGWNFRAYFAIFKLQI